MCIAYVQAPTPNSTLAGQIAKIAKILVFPLKVNRVMVITHISVVTWNAFGKWGGNVGLAHFFMILDYGYENISVIYP